MPKPFRAHYFGAVFGQLIYQVVFFTMGPLFMLGIIFLLGYCLIFLVAAALVAYLRLYFERANA